ncbi:MAG: hypothetical protein Q6M04_00045, partial [Thermostichus sp. BF3_bins_97]
MSGQLSSIKVLKTKPSLQQLARPALQIHPEWRLEQLAQALVRSPGTVGAVILLQTTGRDIAEAEQLVGIVTRAQVAEWRLNPAQPDPQLRDLQDHWLPAQVFQGSLSLEEALDALLAHFDSNPSHSLWVATPLRQGWGLWDPLPQLLQRLAASGSLAANQTDPTLSQLRQQNEL